MSSAESQPRKLDDTAVMAEVKKLLTTDQHATVNSVISALVAKFGPEAESYRPNVQTLYSKVREMLSKKAAAAASPAAPPPASSPAAGDDEGESSDDSSSSGSGDSSGDGSGDGSEDGSGSDSSSENGSDSGSGVTLSDSDATSDDSDAPKAKNKRFDSESLEGLTEFARIARIKLPKDATVETATAALKEAGIDLSHLDERSAKHHSRRGDGKNDLADLKAMGLL